MISRRTLASALAVGAIAVLMPACRVRRTVLPLETSSSSMAVRGWIILVRGDRPFASSRAECDLRAEPPDDAGTCGGGDSTRAGPTGWTDRAGGTFLRRQLSPSLVKQSSCGATKDPGIGFLP